MIQNAPKFYAVLMVNILVIIILLIWLNKDPLEDYNLQRLQKHLLWLIIKILIWS